MLTLFKITNMKKSVHIYLCTLISTVYLAKNCFLFIVNANTNPNYNKI
ncbi:hypothetical protein B4113_3687 [Geobacillus sp. B4113_201601]|nr:hypothetical protein B4113_3687 [Geobacillus sp. B4113_201601]